MREGYVSLPVPRAHRRVVSEAWTRVYLSLWGMTGCAAVLSGAWAPAARAARRVLGLTLSAGATPPPSVFGALGLAAHNIPIASWPLLLHTAGATRTAVARRSGDLAVLVSLGAAALPVGAAFGAYGPALIPFVPQLPLEWAGLALGASGWLVHRRGPLSARTRTGMFAGVCVLMLLAAGIETAAVPHHARRPPRSMAQHSAWDAVRERHGRLDGSEWWRLSVMRRDRWRAP